VLRDSFGKSVAAAVSRMAATSVSFVLCLIYLAFLPFHAWALAVLVGASALAVMLLGRPGDAVTAGITTAVIMVVAAVSPQHAWQQPILRLADTVVGVAVGALAAWAGLQVKRLLPAQSASADPAKVELPERAVVRGSRPARNPLRRRTDRIEAAIRLATVILLIVAVPIAAIAVGRQADHLALRQAHAKQAADHEVTAVVLQREPATGVSDPYAFLQITYVLARWQPPGQALRSGQLLAAAGAPAGSAVTVWTDASGAVTSPPPDHPAIVGAVCIAAVVTCLNAWDADWRATGPRWSSHPG
jgi:Fusaric acid resistance protein-like